MQQPFEETKKGGFLGFLKGTAKGVSGLVVKPISGTLDLFSMTAEGIKNIPDDVALKYRLAGYLYESGKLEDSKQMLHNALSENKEKVTEFYEFFPELEKDANIVAIINQYQN